MKTGGPARRRTRDDRARVSLGGTALARMESTRSCGASSRQNTASAATEPPGADCFSVAARGSSELETRITLFHSFPRASPGVRRRRQSGQAAMSGRVRPQRALTAAGSLLPSFWNQPRRLKEARRATISVPGQGTRGDLHQRLAEIAQARRGRRAGAVDAQSTLWQSHRHERCPESLIERTGFAISSRRMSRSALRLRSTMSSRRPWRWRQGLSLRATRR
jgi:hypothetical protein